MANKVKKRGNSELNVADESGNANPPGQETKQKIKKAKGDQNSTQTDNKPKEAQLAKTSPVNNDNAPGESKNLKKKKANNIKSGFQVTEADSDKKDFKPKKNKVDDPSVAIAKKLKARQIKKEKRKKLRQEQGQNNLQITMSPEDMRKKIEEIKTRENLTKTAKRKLRILKKKLQIAEGTFIPAAPPKIKAGEEGALTKTQKKKLRKEKLQLKIAQQMQNDAVDNSTEQTLIKKKLVAKDTATKQEESGNKKVKLELNNMKSNLKKQKPQKNLQKSEQKIKVPVESEEEDDDSEDESSEEAPVKMEADETNEEGDEDQEEDDDEEGEESDDNKDEEEGEESDDNEDEEEGEESDDDDEEAHKIISKSLKKTAPKNVKKEPEGNKKAPTPKISNQENGDKKQRYVLFVGNLPFKATVEDVKQHFLQKVSEVVSVRIPTDKGTKKPRGFGYVEVSNNVDFEKALSLHQSSLQGFKINVEYTQTGSKNIKNKQELVAKNKKLHAIRKAGKLAGSKKENQKRSFRRNFKKNQQSQED